MEFYKKSIIKNPEFRYQLQYWFEMVLLVWRLYSDDILMIDIQTDPIEHFSIKKTLRNN